VRGSDDVYPANPNFVFSTDDSTIFAFEGVSNDNGDEDWEWKIIDTAGGNSGVRSDFKVRDDGEMAGGLRVRLTFTFSAAGLAAPPYVSVSGLTAEELSVDACPDGILATKVMRLCKGGDDLHNTGFGWLVFLRADKKEPTARGETSTGHLSIANKKFIHYNDDILLPFIKSVREAFGWEAGQQVPEWMTSISWFDGDIPQLQTMLYEAREAVDVTDRVIRNKHAAAATGTQQPCDLSPIFRLLKFMQKRTTAKNVVAVGLGKVIHDLFAFQLRAKGLNLDRNPRKKKALIEFLRCLPEMMERTMTKANIQNSFVEAGMIDAEHKLFPTLDGLISTCKRWVSSSSNIGVSMEMKRHCKEQFPNLAAIQLDAGQVSYADMHTVGIPRGTFP
jgi:hypothetical protein